MISRRRADSIRSAYVPRRKKYISAAVFVFNIVADHSWPENDEYKAMQVLIKPEF